MSALEIRSFRRLVVVVGFTLLIGPRAGTLVGQANESAAARLVYDQIKAFTLTGESAEVADFTLKRDRVDLKFTGTFYFAKPINGAITGAVFVGQGTLHAEPPSGDEFERANVHRMIGADLIESDFKTAVLRFTDDTASQIAGLRREAAVPPQASKLAADLDATLLRDTGANLSARLAGSLLNGETPGVFFADVDGGRRGRFSLLIDRQTRLPVANFRVNAGERGLIFAYQPATLSSDVWMAFRGLEDYEKGIAPYSDANDLVDVTRYQMNLDLRELGKRIGITARVELRARTAGLRAIPFSIGESLTASQQTRLEKQLRVKAARVGSQSATWAQEDWEGGLTVFLPKALQAGEVQTVEIDLDGDFMNDNAAESFFPLSNTEWYPRHGYLDRAAFDLTFRHRKRDHVASIGVRLSEQPDPEDPNALITKYQMTEPVALAVFAVAPYERHVQDVKWDQGDAPIPLVFNSVPARLVQINRDFVLAELNNAVRFFAAMFGKYPYPSFGAALHPFGFGQGFPTLLMIPPTSTANKETFVFLAHETAHQWWGNIVAWRSYRDQWLSEGFAEYSGVLYTDKRDTQNPKAASDLIRTMRESLRNTPRTALGMGKGRLNDIGPLIMGLRLNTSQTYGAYQALVYNKGALVLRMLHFLMSNPQSNPATDASQPFFQMMSQFVEKYRNGAATTDDFRAVANAHFARTPIAQKYGLTDLNWFFRQWVYRLELPSYELEYALVDQPDGSVLIKGTVRQDGVPPDSFMPLPVVFTFDGNRTAQTVVKAFGASSDFELKLPARPKKVDLDPNSWVLSEKMTVKAK